MRDFRYSASFLVGALIFLPGHTACAAEASHPVVAGFERFYAGEKADLAAGGQLLLSELNCVSCHQQEGAIVRKQAPVLDGVANRVRINYLKKYLGDPHAVKPGTTMPNLFADDPDKAAKIEAIAQYLGSTGILRQERPDIKSAILGRDVYAKVGCVACHGPRDLTGQPAKDLPAYIVPLGDLKSKYSITGLTSFLENPLLVRPSGRMPHLVVAKEARDLANYLLQGLKVNVPQNIGATGYTYYEGAWQKLPDFSKLKAIGNGTGAAFDLGAAKRGNDFGLRFEGFFKLAAAGEYNFSLTSDDGSKLYIDGKLVVSNDGIHPPQTVSGRATLTKEEPHQVVVEFMNGGGGAELAVEIEGRGLARQSLGAHVAPTAAGLDRKPPPMKVDDEDAVMIDPELAKKGKALFASVGCANCHQMTADKKLIASDLLVPEFSRLKAGGCIAEKTPKVVPDFSLSAKQKAALAAVLKAPPAENKEPAAVIARTMTTLNCYACHSRDKIGGPTEEMNKFFLTVQPEMGDEGRVPPPLDGVGGKLNPDYFKQILDKGVHDRPYMHTHMPGFGTANIGHLQSLFASLDKIPPAGEVKFDVPDSKVYSAARHMVGEQALACIKCHTFNNVKAEGIQGIDMTMIPKRVTRDWFHYYMLDPQKVRPGTRMPSAFLNGVSPLPQVLDGKAASQIEAMWAYLKLGTNAALPLGMGKKSIPLMPLKETIIYRNFIQGAGPRGIAVGYPEKVSIAFDANDVRLALLWQGAFIDAAKHWTDRGVGFEGPLGDNVLTLPSGPPCAVLAKPDAAWPTTPSRDLGYKFIGYRTSPDERPTFDYSFNGVKIEDFPNPSTVGKDSSLKRTLKLSASTSSSVENLYFRAAAGKKIEAAGDGWYKIDGWKMKIDSAAAPQIRTVDGKSELIVPVQFKDGQAQIVQEFLW